MLIQFKVKNFRSIRDEAILDLSATKESKNSDQIVTVGKEKILPVAAIYGANASGKSNVYKALHFMSQYVIESFKYGDDDRDYQMTRPAPFLFDKRTADQPSTFELHFTVPGDESEKIYNYGFSIGKSGIEEEWLFTKSRMASKYIQVIYRNNEGFELRGFTKAERSSLEAALNPQVLIVSLGAKLRIEKCKGIRNWFLLNEFSDFGNTIQTVKKQHEISEEFVESTEARSDVVEYISTFDKSIIGFDVQEIPKKDDNEEQYYKVTAFHKPVDGSENVGIPLEEESAGTLKMFSLYPDLLSVIQNGGLYCVDELNARLHPLLVRNILLCFINPAINIHHAQLIFTTHDTWMLRTDILRRDEIWFTEKNEQGMTELYSLAEFVEGNNQNLSYGEKLERNYFLGKYGAIPSVERIDLLKEDRDGEE